MIYACVNIGWLEYKVINKCKYYMNGHVIMSVINKSVKSVNASTRLARHHLKCITIYHIILVVNHIDRRIIYTKYFVVLVGVSVVVVAVVVGPPELNF